MKNAKLKIVTPEGIVFSLRLAGPVSRFLAWSVDAAVISAAGTVLSLALMPLGLFSFDLATAVIVLGYLVISIGYGISTEWFWRGQTLGKKLLRLRVMDEAALALQPSQIVIRNLVRAIDAFPLLYLLGGVTMLLSRKHQRLGDIAANTVVIHSVKERLPDLAPVRGKHFNALRDELHLAARLATRLTPKEAALGLEALRRRDRLTPEACIDVFRELADHYRRRVVFPDAVVEHLADEQYVRNVIDVVYRPECE